MTPPSMTRRNGGTRSRQEVDLVIKNASARDPSDGDHAKSVRLVANGTFLSSHYSLPWVSEFFWWYIQTLLFFSSPNIILFAFYQSFKNHSGQVGACIIRELEGPRGHSERPISRPSTRDSSIMGRT